MNRKQKIFQALYRKYTEEVLAYIYTNGSVSYKEIRNNFSEVSDSTIRKAVDRLVSAGLIESILDFESSDKRAKVYIVKDVSATISVLELDIDD